MNPFSSFTLELIEQPELVEDNLNNNYKDASAFPVPGSVTDRIYLQSDVDFYEFTLETPRFLQLDFTCPSSTKDFFLTLYKESDQNLIDGIDSVGGEDVTLNMGLGVGHYYLKVAGNGTDADTVNPYTLTFSDSDQTNLEIESNNTLKFANALEKDAVKKGRIYSSADIDYFGFYVPETVIFTVEFTPATTTGDYTISLVDDNDQMFTQRTSTNGETHIINAFKTPGNYYVKIENNGDVDQYNYYDLSLGSTAAIVGLKQLVSVTIAGSQNDMLVSDTQALTATAGYSDATSEGIASPEWSSLDDTVATVDAAGNVTAVGEGTTSIIASFGELAGRFDITVGSPPIVFDQHYGNLIVVAGGGVAASNTLKESTQYLSDLVYRRFKNRLFQDEDIFYLNPMSWHDINGDGYSDDIVDDSSPTVAEFGSSITTWAANRSSDGPLYIYLIDHGGIDSFEIFPGEVLSASQLNSFINTFQTATGRKVIVMIEACKSGSFTNDLITAGSNRVAVTCTDDNNAYQQLNGRISFTQFFVDRLLTGHSVFNAWLSAKNSLSNMGLPYNLMDPQLVEGVSMAAVQTIVGGNFAIASLFSEITGQSPNASITANTSHSFYATLSDLDGIEAVWAVVLPPHYVAPATSADLEAPEVALPTFDLTDPDKNGTYDADYSDFTYNGDYQITFYARNENGNVTPSPATIITVSGGQEFNSVDLGDVNNSGTVDLTDAILVLQVLAGIELSLPLYIEADVNGDSKISLEEAIHALQVISGIRE